MFRVMFLVQTVVYPLVYFLSQMLAATRDSRLAIAAHNLPVLVYLVALAKRLRIRRPHRLATRCFGKRMRVEWLIRYIVRKIIYRHGYGLYYTPKPVII
jgi:hypothetical protein